MRKTYVIFIVLLILLTVGGITAFVRAETTRLDAATMKAALRTTAIEEQGFIDDVLILVNEGIIPADLVDSTFQWARKKNSKHRFQYFKKGLIVRAEKIEIDLQALIRDLHAS